MRSVLFTIGPLTVYGYGLMVAVGILAAFYVGQKRAVKYQLSADSIFTAGVVAGIGGIVGAKLFYYFTELPAIIKDPSLLLNFSDGFVVYGGIILGILTGFVYTVIRKLNFLKYFDLVMPSIALAQGFGRIGCLLAGCCYGIETDAWFGITFTNSPAAPNGVSLMPTQIFSSELDFLNFFVLIWFARYAKHDGEVGALYLILYSIGRFLIEFLRGDLERGSVGVLSTSQFIAIFTLIFGVFLFLYCHRRLPEKKPLADKTEKEAAEENL